MKRSGSSERVVEVGCSGHYSFLSYHVYDILVLSNIVFHLFLDVRVVFQQVLKVFLAVREILLQFVVLIEKIVVDSLDLFILSLGQGEFLTFLLYRAL